MPASPVLGLGCRGEERRDQVAVAVLGEAVAAVFIFLYFIFLFFIKIYFSFRNLQKYIRPPRCRAAGTWSLRYGAAGAFLQPGGPVARQRGGRPWPPDCGVTSRNF